jgi:DNA-binding MarR family transcriptional regulator
MSTGAKRQQGQLATGSTAAAADLTQREFEQLADFRHALRRFARYTELEARRVGLTPQQYQLMLAIKGFPGRDWANISELAERLQIRHNAVIGLVNRAEEHGLVRRQQDAERGDRRVVQIHLTQQGDIALNRLASALRDERMRVRAALEALDQDQDQSAANALVQEPGKTAS